MNFDKELLRTYYQPDGPERVGFILFDGEIIEVDNICTDPENGFEVRGRDLVRYGSSAYASWHTHPGKDYDANMTMDDHKSFLAYSKLRHFIIGSDRVAEYYVEDGAVFNSE